MMNTAVFGEGRLPDAPRPRYWAARELVAIGIFAAAAKLTSLLIALAGGGMNPATLLLKNLVFTTLVVVMLYKVRKQWTLLLFTTVNMLISLILLGGSVTLIPTASRGRPEKPVRCVRGGWGLGFRGESPVARGLIPLRPRNAGPCLDGRAVCGDRLHRFICRALHRSPGG